MILTGGASRFLVFFVMVDNNIMVDFTPLPLIGYFTLFLQAIVIEQKNGPESNSQADHFPATVRNLT